MKKQQFPFTLSSRRGSSIVFVLMITVVLSLIGASLIRYALTEKNLHYRSLTRTHAQYAVESTLENAHAQLITAMQNLESLPRHYLKPDRENLQSPTELADFYRMMNVDAAKVEILGVTSPVRDAQETLLEALKRTQDLPESDVEWSEWVTVDQNDPANAMDNLRGMRVLIREVDLLSRAQAQRGHVRTPVFGRQTLEIRDAPLFAYGAYFNMDMEYSPGQPADFHGSLHVNGNFYFQSNNGLTFYDSVMVTDQVKHGWHPARGLPDYQGGGHVSFRNPVLNASIPFDFGPKPATNTGYNSALPGWHAYALDTYQGGLLNGEHGVLPSIPIATDDSIEEISAWNLISPPNRISDIVDADTERQEAIRQFERAKFSRSASLYIRVDPMLEKDPLVRVGEGEWVNLPFEAAAVNGRSDDPWSMSMASPALPPEMIQTRRGFDLYDPRENGIDIYYLNEDGEKTTLVHPHLMDNNQNQIRLPREDAGMYLASIDISILRDWLEAENPSWWNGVIYVENVNYSDPLNENFIDPADFADNGTAPVKSGIRIINAETLPRRYNIHQADGTIEDGWGFTFITNGPVYVQGHFNADGDPATPSYGLSDPARDPDLQADLDPSAPGYIPQEVPAAIVGDGITILSSAWEDHLPYSENYYRNLPHQQGNFGTQHITFLRDAGFTEISAGLISGIVPTTADYYSGGLENFPRLLENWGPWRHDGDAPPPGPATLDDLDEGEESEDAVKRMEAILEFHELLQDMPGSFQVELGTSVGWWSLSGSQRDDYWRIWNDWLLTVKAFVESDRFEPGYFDASELPDVDHVPIGAWVRYLPDENSALFEAFDFDFGRFYRVGFVPDNLALGNRFGHTSWTGSTMYNEYDFGTGIPMVENPWAIPTGYSFRGWTRWHSNDSNKRNALGRTVNDWDNVIHARINNPDNHWMGTYFYHPVNKADLRPLRDVDVEALLEDSSPYQRLPQMNINATSRWNMDDQKLRIRGSLVGLYESRFATGPWIGSIHYFPPEREWGFHRFFAEGQYPPGSLMARSYRVRNYEEISEAEYLALRAGILEYYAAIPED